MALEKIKILGALLELPAKEHCQSSQFTSKLDQIGQIGSMYCLAGSSKRAPRVFIFSIALGAEHLPYLCEIHCYQFPHIFWVYYFSLSLCVYGAREAPFNEQTKVTDSAVSGAGRYPA